jgi:hypothetical protein
MDGRAQGIGDRRPPLVWPQGRPAPLLLAAAEAVLRADPTAETRNLKTLRPNPVAERELSLFGKCRVLFHLDSEARVATIVLVGETREDALNVQGEEFRGRHEDHSAE